jgi:hypothetical protein
VLGAPSFDYRVRGVTAAAEARASPVKGRITVPKVTRSGSTTTVQITVTSDGYNSPGAFHFDLREDKVKRLVFTS